jgi:hypothetical protein
MLLWNLSDETVLKAIVDAPKFTPELSSRLGGVMFFSTPHWDGKTADMDTVLTGIVNVAAYTGSLGPVKDHLQHNILKELDALSQSLRILHEEFRRVAMEADLIVNSVVEMKATVINGKSLGVVCDLPFSLL